MNEVSNTLLRLGRQPIFGRKSELLAYELLYRDDSSKDSANIVDGNLATATVLTNALLEMGLDSVAGDARAFVNFPAEYLNGERPVPFGQNKIVIEVLENVVIDERVIDGLWQLAQKGYLIALDDFEYSSEWDACLEIASIVKLDVLALGAAELREQINFLKPYKVTLLAEKVEDHQTHQMCLDLGFELFQGYYYAKPNILEGKKAQASQSALLKTLAAVNDEESEMTDIADAVSQDAVLSHKLLRYVNSSAIGRRYSVDSVDRAIVYLGKQEVRSIATLLLMTSIVDKPLLLVKTALIRAQACQNLAKAWEKTNHQAYFTAGLLSLLDALLDRSMGSIVDELPLNDEVKQAIVNCEGQIGSCLSMVIAYETLEIFEADLADHDIAECIDSYCNAIDSVERDEGMAVLLPKEKNAGALDKIGSQFVCA